MSSTPIPASLFIFFQVSKNTLAFFFFFSFFPFTFGEWTPAEAIIPLPLHPLEMDLGGGPWASRGGGGKDVCLPGWPSRACVQMSCFPELLCHRSLSFLAPLFWVKDKEMEGEAKWAFLISGNTLDAFHADYSFWPFFSPLPSGTSDVFEEGKHPHSPRWVFG